MQPISINFAAIIADRQSFLDGARSFTLDGEDQPSTGRRLSMSIRWPVQGEEVDEGDLTIIEGTGDELYGTLSGGRASEVTDQDGNVGAANLDLLFDITGGEGQFSGATGTVRLAGTIAGEGDAAGGTYSGEGAILTAEISMAGSAAAPHKPTQAIPTGTPVTYQEPAIDAPDHG